MYFNTKNLTAVVFFSHILIFKMYQSAWCASFKGEASLVFLALVLRFPNMDVEAKVSEKLSFLKLY